MKYLFYSIPLLASLGLFGMMINPSLLQQAANLAGIEWRATSSETDEKQTAEDRLARFMEQYPSAQPKTDTASALPFEPSPVPISLAPMPVESLPAENVMIPQESAHFPLPVPSLEQPRQPSYEPDYWNGENVTPIPEEVSEPAQPFSMPPQATVPQPEPQPVLAESVPPSPFRSSSYEQTSYEQSSLPLPVSAVPAPLVQAAYSPQPVLSPPHSTIHTSAVLIEDVPVYGTETVARVGNQVILMGDILPKLRRSAMRTVNTRLEKMSEAEKAATPPEEIEQFIDMFVEKEYPGVLEEQILFSLIYSDFDKYKSIEEKNFFFTKLGEEFDRSIVPQMIEEFHVGNMMQLKQHLEEKLGSSLEKERRLWVRENIARQWVGQSVQQAAGECTYDEMQEYYEANKDSMFTNVAKARWQEMVVLFSQQTEEEAYKKISWMGNQVTSGAPFEKIAEVNSDGFTASQGGVWDWTTKGSLTSLELEQAIFTLPIGALSPSIIRSDKGLHIIKVLERQEEQVLPFVEAQGTIREKIQSQRTMRNQQEYFAELRRLCPIQIMKPNIDFKVSSLRSANGAVSLR